MQIKEADLINPEFQIDQEELPSGKFILTRDIKKALDGQDFKYYNNGGGMPISIKGIKQNSYNSYFQEFHDFKLFGLPHGRGKLNELPWLIDLLRFMDSVHGIIERWQVDRPQGNDSLSTEEAGF